MQVAPLPYPDDERNTVSLVIPLYNEEAVVPRLIQEVDAFRTAHPEVTQVILVDDGSTDSTRTLIRELTSGKLNYCLVSFSRNFGHQLAISAGMHLVETDAAVILDADLQDPLPVVAEMIERWREGYDVVYGVRQTREGETAFKLATARLFYRFFRWLTDLDMPVDTGDFRLVSRGVLNAYRQITEHQPFVRGLIAWLGFNQVGIPYERAPRAAGKTKYSLRKMASLAFGSFTSFSDRPLKLAVKMGLLTAGLSLCGLLWVLVVKYIRHAAIPGWSSIVFVAFFFGGLQLLFLGVVGLYLDRVYDEVKARPRYIIRDEWRSDASSRLSDSAVTDRPV